MVSVGYGLLGSSYRWRDIRGGYDLVALSFSPRDETSFPETSRGEAVKVTLEGKGADETSG